MMSAYRELDDTTKLDKHLETCASCREALANYTQIGEQMHSAPVFAPPPDAHARLMQALADEHLKFLQKSAPGKVSTPEFLKPYLQERADETQAQDDVAAFSSAETGPLPIIHARRRLRKAQVNQFAVLGLTAVILIMLMMGGLTSLLMLARSNPSSLPKNSAVSLAQQAEVDQKTYTTNTPYTNITSLLPYGNVVYYTASINNNGSNSWMLMQFDRNTQISTPLLNTPSSNPLILLTVSDTRVVWLEYDRPQLITHGSIPDPKSSYSPNRAWHLSYLSLVSQPESTAGTPKPPTPLLLAQGTFDSSNAPTGVTTPIQGVWLVDDTLLVAQIDQQGISHLDSYLLGQDHNNTRKVEIAKAAPGHVFTSPTANSTGMDIYWADEWISADGRHSNIWEQQAIEQNAPFHGNSAPQTSFTQTLLMNDGMSFQPQVVNDTLFFISTSEVVVSNQGANQTPNGTPFPASATDTSVVFTPRTDLNIYPAPADASVHGTIFMIPLDGVNIGSESMLGTVGQSTGFQAGNGFVIWQDNTGYHMYDLSRQGEIMLGDTLNNAALLVVNANTALWLTKNDATASGGQLTMMAFSWPS